MIPDPKIFRILRLVVGSVKPYVGVLTCCFGMRLDYPVRYCPCDRQPVREGMGCGVSPPHDEVLLFRQKNPKPVAPGRGPQEGVPLPRSLVCGLRNSLRSDSPRRHMKWMGPGRSPARRRRDNYKEQRRWIP